MLTSLFGVNSPSVVGDGTIDHFTFDVSKQNIGQGTAISIVPGSAVLHTNDGNQPPLAISSLTLAQDGHSMTVVFNKPIPVYNPFNFTGAQVSCSLFYPAQVTVS